MIPKLLSSTWMIWMISIKILKNAIQIKDYWSYLMICLLICLVIENIIHKYFSCFYLTILSCYTEKNQHTILLWKFQKKWALASRIQSFIRYWLSRFYEFLQKCTAKPYLFLVIDTVVASENSCFLERI